MFALRHKISFPQIFITRLYNTQTALSSASIRSRFLEYFVGENDHTFVRSCPLKPISDDTIPFVNAGMVQFKPVLQGQSIPPATLVANSQKCARVGGKHNDLSSVGMDGYHHTFFEMLGNWSFGECNKFEACKLAWTLLTGPYGLNPNRLYVTYFAGDKSMSLAPDLETKEIWMQLGVEESHILPFGANENFWEMGLVGPCGPCTEIHVDHIPDRINAGAQVNAGLPELTELWNIVFVQFNRNAKGVLEPLKQAHVDTGMGFERLVAVLNGAQSNYDTDLFNPLMEAIHKISGCPAYSYSFDRTGEAFERDRAYRILCDHSRLLTVALADGVVPHNECKLRWVLRRALNIAKDVMKSDEKLLLELSNYVAESLHGTFPEIGKNLTKVKRVIKNEAEIFRHLKMDYPKAWLQLMKEKPELENLLEFGSTRGALASAYMKMTSIKSPEVSLSLASHLYESHGMNSELIGEMAKFLGKSFDCEAHQKELDNMKFKSKLATASSKSSDNLTTLLASAGIPQTCDTFKYDYDLVKDEYTFPSISAKIVGLLVKGELEKSAAGGTQCGVILDQTNFYHTAGGQVSDEGEIHIKSKKTKCYLSVQEVTKIGGHVIHFGELNGSCKVGDVVETKIHESNRISCMRNHTLSHIINGEIQRIFEAPIQEKCTVLPSYLKLKYFLHGEEFNINVAKKLEEAVRHAIDSELFVDRYTVNKWQIPPSTTLVPDETYPVENIHIIDIKKGAKIFSREACCGTHVSNTRDIGKFCIVEVIKSKHLSVCAVTGVDAEEAMRNSFKLTDHVNRFTKEVVQMKASIRDLEEIVLFSSDLPPLKSYISSILKVHKNYVKVRNFIQENSRRISYVTFDAASNSLEQGSSMIHDIARFLSELEVKRKSEGAKYIAHVMQLSELLQKVPLNKYTRLVNIPVMLFSFHKDELKVRCCIPQNMVNENFNASNWMRVAVDQLVESDQDAEMTINKDGLTATVQSRSIVYKNKIGMRLRRERCWKACEAADKFALSHLKSKK